MLRLNSGPDYDPATESLLAASSTTTKKKPTFRIRRLVGSGKLKGASSISKERERAEKALRLNGIA
jgi:hypothetical protein